MEQIERSPEFEIVKVIKYYHSFHFIGEKRKEKNIHNKMPAGNKTEEKVEAVEGSIAYFQELYELCPGK